MSETLRYMRGQIWHWDDPLYGKKEDRQNISPLEETFRFSRYVLIVQSNDLPFVNNLLVIPLSSKKCCKTDIRISLVTSKKKDSYLRPERIFPINPKSLTSYMCTINENIMDEIDAILVRLMLPSFFQSKSFDDYMKMKNVDISKYKEIKYISKAAETSPAKMKWDENEMMKFIAHYDEYGIDETAETYSLSLTTTKRYYNKFLKSIKTSEDESPNVTTTVDVEKLSDSISAYSNEMIELLNESGFYENHYHGDESKEIFFKTLGSSIYHTLGSLFEMKLVKKKLEPGNLTSSVNVSSQLFIYSWLLKTPHNFYTINQNFYTRVCNKMSKKLEISDDVLGALISEMKRINGEV